MCRAQRRAEEGGRPPRTDRCSGSLNLAVPQGGALGRHPRPKELADMGRRRAGTRHILKKVGRSPADTAVPLESERGTGRSARPLFEPETRRTGEPLEPPPWASPNVGYPETRERSGQSGGRRFVRSYAPRHQACKTGRQRFSVQSQYVTLSHHRWFIHR